MANVVAKIFAEERAAKAHSLRLAYLAGYCNTCGSLVPFDRIAQHDYYHALVDVVVAARDA